MSVSLSPTQTGAPVFPNILPAAPPPGVLVNFTTMNPHMQNAYSEQGSLEIEQQIGSRATLSVGYQHLRGLHLIISVNQNVPTCVASGTTTAAARIRPLPTTASTLRWQTRTTTDCTSPLCSVPCEWGNYRVSYTCSKSLDNVGEFFFSSPIDNVNIWQDYGRSDDDQRHRVDGASISGARTLEGHMDSS